MLKSVIALTVMVAFFLFLDDYILYELLNLWVHFQFKLKALVYAGAFIFSCWVLSSMAISNSKKTFLPAVILATLLIYIDQIYKLLNGHGITYEEILILYQNVGFGLGGQIVYTYFPFMIKALAIPLLFLLLIFILRKTIRPQMIKGKVLVPGIIAALLINYAIIDYSNGIRTSFPSPLKIPSLAFYTFNSMLYYGPKEPVTAKVNVDSTFDHIIWIVDESVRGDQLSINDITLSTTPYLRSLEGNHLINLGVASSASVCSDYSHIIMMSGIQPERLPDTKDVIRKSPTIFQYALNAGYETNLIYSPGYEDEPKGFLTDFDFEYIHHRFNTKMDNPGMPHYLFDFESLNSLNGIIRSQEKSFTYFLKYGCHFHYETAYPPEKKYFTPTQEISDWKRENRTVLLNSYYNALRWTVDDFFKLLMEKFNGLNEKKIMIIYTSDHGQNLLEHEDINLTHCTKSNAPPVMANVPMALLSPDTTHLSLIPKIRNTPGYHPSHFQIFPTTLELMGYDSSFVSQEYGSTLFSKSRDSSYIFMSGDIFGRSVNYKNRFYIY